MVALGILILFLKVIDLSHAVDEKIPIWPGGVPFSRQLLADWDKDGYRMFKLCLGENVGTHVDAPAHFIKGAPFIDDIKKLLFKGVMIDISKKVEKNPDYALSREDIEKWEKKYGKIPVGSFVIVRTDWWKRWQDPKKYVNMKHGVMHFPGISPEAARILVERKVAGVGIDTLSLDPGNSKTFDAHKILLGAGIFGVENLTNLDKLPPKGFEVFVGVVKIKDGTQAPARVIAVVR